MCLLTTYLNKYFHPRVVEVLGALGLLRASPGESFSSNKLLVNTPLISADGLAPDHTTKNVWTQCAYCASRGALQDQLSSIEVLVAKENEHNEGGREERNPASGVPKKCSARSVYFRK